MGLPVESLGIIIVTYLNGYVKVCSATLQRRNLQLQQSLSVLWPIIPKENSKHLRLDVKLLQETIYIICSNHITKLLQK